MATTIETPRITETAAAVDAGRKATSVGERLTQWPPKDSDGTDIIPVYLDTSGNVVVAGEVVEAARELGIGPIRRDGTAQFHDLESFLAYVQRYRNDEETVVFADIGAFKATAIFDYHPKGPDTKAARWTSHRAVYTCPRSPEWAAWTANDGRAMPQEAFADFIEAHLDDLTSTGGGKGEPKDYPAPLAILEMARNLMVRTTGQFQRAIDPTTGTGTLICKTEHGSESTKIPRAFLLALRVFEGGEPYRVEARLRFSLAEGRARFQYDLHRRTEIERDAFGDVRKTIAKTGAPVFGGSP